MSEIIDAPGLAASSVRRKRRMSAIWIIPLLAVAIAAWLAWNTLSQEGPTITVSFQDGEGLQAGQSQLKFKNLTLGTVKSMDLSADHSRVIVTIATTRAVVPLLSDQTVFWVVKPRLFAGTVSGLNTLISGSYIGMLPGTTAGKQQRNFIGLEDPPVLLSNVPGRTFLVKADRLGSVSVGSPVFFRDLDVGEVLGWDLGDMAQSATIHVFVRQPFDQYVHDTTRFWNASGLNVNLGAGGVNVQVESLRALLLGGIAFENPTDIATGQVSAANRTFPLFANQQAANAASYGERVQFVANFPGSVRGLVPGSDVTFLGLKVGQVKSVGLTFDAATDRVLAPVKFEIEPERVLGVGKRAFATPKEGFDLLVKRGLRATLQSGSLLTGEMLVALQMDPNAPPTQMTMQDGVFVMPTVGSGGLESIEAAATDLLNKVNAMPFDQIGKSLASTLQGANDLTNGPQLQQAVESLNETMSGAQDTLHKLDSGLTPVLRQLPEMSNKLQGSLTNLNKLLLSLNTGYGDNTEFNRNLERLMIQLDSMVQSFRSLADLLNRHPEALIRGRTDTGTQ